MLRRGKKKQQVLRAVKRARALGCGCVEKEKAGKNYSQLYNNGEAKKKGPETAKGIVGVQRLYSVCVPFVTWHNPLTL